MTEEERYMNFIPGVVSEKEKSEEDLCFIFYNGKMLFRTEFNDIEIPTRELVRELTSASECEHYLGSCNGTSCYVYKVVENINLQKTLQFMDLRVAGLQVEEQLFFICGKASQVLNWSDTHKYCGRCGNKTEPSLTERAMVCPKCGLISYPRISPAIIVGVTRGDEILLAHNKGFKDGLFSVIAGFVEPGELFEECVKREVYEEVGIRVKNIKYFGNQPWPFPNSLMIGFTAEYESGEVKVDGVEIGEAKWVKADSMPTIPTNISIARKIIDAFIEEHRNK